MHLDNLKSSVLLKLTLGGLYKALKNKAGSFGGFILEHHSNILYSFTFGIEIEYKCDWINLETTVKKWV